MDTHCELTIHRPRLILAGNGRCENCVEVLFVRGSGLCVQCKAPVRKVNFRYQLFEDALVQKEVELRKKILSEYVPLAN